MRVAPSRTKMNFYGTLNLQTGEEIVLRTKKLNSATTAAYLVQILETYPDVLILFFWDRAPWHRGTAIPRVARKPTFRNDVVSRGSARTQSARTRLESDTTRRQS